MDTSNDGDANRLNKSNSIDTPWYGSALIFINALIGAGMLNFPLAYHKSGGIPMSLTVQLILYIVFTCSLFAFVNCAKERGCKTYQEVILKYCGPKMNMVCLVICTLDILGTAMIYFVIIGDQWDKFMQMINENFLDVLPWYLNRKMFMTFGSIIFILPFCFSKRIDCLKYVSSLGFLLVIYCVLLVSIRYFVGVGTSKVGPMRYWPEHFGDVFLIIPTFGFAFQSHTFAMSVYVCTKDRDVNHNFSKTIISSLTLVFILYSTLAIFSYLTFGSCVQADILLSYKPTYDIFVAVLVVALKIFVTYPVTLFLGRSFINDLWLILMNSEIMKSNSENNLAKTNFKTYESFHTDGNKMFANDSQTIECNMDTNSKNMIHDKHQDHSDKHEIIRRVIITLIFFTSTLMVALFVPDIDKLISFVGCLPAFLTFVFPGLCQTQYLLDGITDNVQINKKDDTDNHQINASYNDSIVKKFQYYLSFSLAIGSVLFGLFLFVLTFIQSVIKHSNDTGSLICEQNFTYML